MTDHKYYTDSYTGRLEDKLRRIRNLCDAEPVTSSFADDIIEILNEP